MLRANRSIRVTLGPAGRRRATHLLGADDAAARGLERGELDVEVLADRADARVTDDVAHVVLLSQLLLDHKQMASHKGEVNSIETRFLSRGAVPSRFTKGDGCKRWNKPCGSVGQLGETSRSGRPPPVSRPPYGLAAVAVGPIVGLAFACRADRHENVRLRTFVW
jgi:hypothetical protein